jgi:hypothetical protein
MSSAAGCRVHAHNNSQTETRDKTIFFISLGLLALEAAALRAFIHLARQENAVVERSSLEIARLRDADERAI